MDDYHCGYINFFKENTSSLNKLSTHVIMEKYIISNNEMN
jgi:hypothetical protein